MIFRFGQQKIERIFVCLDTNLLKRKTKPKLSHDEVLAAKQMQVQYKKPSVSSSPALAE